MNSDTDRQIRDKTWGEGLLESQTDRLTYRQKDRQGFKKERMTE